MTCDDEELFTRTLLVVIRIFLIGRYNARRDWSKENRSLLHDSCLSVVAHTSANTIYFESKG